MTTTGTDVIATPELRFVRRDGKLILQQAFLQEVCETDGNFIRFQRREWRDVPLADE